MTDDGLILRVTRTVAAPRERVWRAWTEPAELARWLWPEHFATTCTFEARVGGHFRIASEVAATAVSGDVVAVVPPSRLVLTWRWDGEPAETLVTVTLADVDAGTEVVVVHERFGSAAERDGHAQGWRDCLGRLAPHLG